MVAVIAVIPVIVMVAVIVMGESAMKGIEAIRDGNFFKPEDRRGFASMRDIIEAAVKGISAKGVRGAGIKGTGGRGCAKGTGGRGRAKEIASDCKAHAAAVLGSLLLASCASAPPSDTMDICSMFEERRNWHEAAIRSERKWSIPLSVSMAIIQQESSFTSNARPPRKKILGVIPGPRPSSAFGFAQVLDDTWTDYRAATGNWGASRTNFADAVDFVGWYNNNSNRINGIARDDAYNLYLAYHEGNGGYSRGTYNDKPWLIDVSRRVQSNADNYARQYAQCERELNRSWLMRVLSSVAGGAKDLVVDNLGGGWLKRMLF